MYRRINGLIVKWSRLCKIGRRDVAPPLRDSRVLNLGEAGERAFKELRMAKKVSAKQLRLRAHAEQIVEALRRGYPDAVCALKHRNAYELLVATILSAQCTDARVNMVTPELFRRFPDAARLAKADPAELEEIIRSTGFFRAKTRNLLAMAREIASEHGGNVPEDLDALTALPGIGRKTANVVLGTAFGIASGVVVDTHVKRISRRLGLTKSRTPEQIERDLMEVIPPTEWVNFSHRLIHHGRGICLARKPRCESCSLEVLCPKIGVPAPKSAAAARPGVKPSGKARRSQTKAS
jgi:endonuclease-3